MEKAKKICKLKPLLGINEEDSSKDALVKFAIETAEEVIKDYCNIEEVPEGLINTLLRMAMDIYRNEQPGSGEVPQAVTSVREGDTSTGFGVVETAGYKESMLKDYRKQLKRYRKVFF